MGGREFGGQIIGGDKIAIVSDQQKAGGAFFALGDGVGRQGAGNAYKLDVVGLFDLQAIECFANAADKVVMGGQRFAEGKDFSRVIVEKRCICIGTPRVDSDDILRPGTPILSCFRD